MESQNINDAFQAAVERLLAEAESASNTDIYRYARTVAKSFEDIQALRERGVRFDKICKLLETTGWLQENADVHSLRQAFIREKARRNKIGGHTATTLETKKSGGSVNGGSTQSKEKKMPESTSPALRTSGVTSARRQTTTRNGAGMGVKAG